MTCCKDYVQAMSGHLPTALHEKTLKQNFSFPKKVSVEMVACIVENAVALWPLWLFKLFGLPDPAVRLRSQDSQNFRPIVMLQQFRQIVFNFMFHLISGFSRIYMAISQYSLGPFGAPIDFASVTCNKFFIPLRRQQATKQPSNEESK